MTWRSSLHKGCIVLDGAHLSAGGGVDPEISDTDGSGLAGGILVHRNARPHRRDRRSTILQELRKDEGDSEDLVHDHELRQSHALNAVDRQLDREWLWVSQREHSVSDRLWYRHPGRLSR